ncbi:MAG: FlgD immunoglobulin-like domain containing protein [Aureispira sp.]
MKQLLFLTLLLSMGQLSAQTYADDIAALFFDKCTSCHHAGGIGPFSLMSYTDASIRLPAIQNAVTTKRMPPWSPDNSYSQFAHDRSLTQAQITLIDNWINAGAPQGNPSNTPPAPIYDPNNWVLGQPDLSIKMPDYVSKATTSNDDYICISIPTNLAAGRTIQAIEVIPGNSAVVHHALIHIDAAGTYATDTTSHACGGPTSLPLIAGYAPGSDPAQFPNTSNFKLGINLPANSHIVFAMHYPAGSQGILDSTRLNIHFYPQGTAGVREVSANPILNSYNFTINANTVDEVEDWFPTANFPVNSDFSLFSIFPHAHLIGKSFIVYGVNHFPPYDTIPLIHVPEWDFEWQGFYVFEYMKKLPAGYKLYGKAVYDNTTNNPFNPNNPPQNISAGLNTSDEMFLIYFQYLNYQQGDETINIDSLLQAQNTVYTNNRPLAVHENGLFLTAYPNPSSELTTIHYYLDKEEEVQLMVYDAQGRVVRQLALERQTQGQHLYQWDGRQQTGQSVPAGIYSIQLRAGEKIVHKKIIRQ